MSEKVKCNYCGKEVNKINLKYHEEECSCEGKNSNWFKRHPIWTLVFFIFVFFNLWGLFSNPSNENETSFSEDDTYYPQEIEENKTINLHFYDNTTTCDLNGEIYLDEDYLGEAKGGIFGLSKQTYNEKFHENSSLMLSGLTSECFGKDSNLPFTEIWYPNLNEYSFNQESADFFVELTPRRPKYYSDIQRFVRPEETRDYLDKKIKKYFTPNDTKQNLDKISEFSIWYRGDFGMFNQADYWQTPSEALKLGSGDCEDWALATLSMMREYNLSVECYNSLWDTHLSIICFLDNSMIIYDQGGLKFETSISFKGLNELEKKVKVRKLRDKYLDDFGIKPEETSLHALFNENDLIIFEESEEFIEWVVQRETL